MFTAISAAEIGTKDPLSDYSSGILCLIKKKKKVGGGASLVCARLWLFGAVSFIVFLFVFFTLFHGAHQLVRNDGTWLWEAEAGETWVQGQPALHSEASSLNNPPSPPLPNSCSLYGSTVYSLHTPAFLEIEFSFFFGIKRSESKEPTVSKAQDWGEVIL